MPTPIDHIRSGIARGDWGDVCRGFAMLTGESHDPPAGGSDARLVERIAAVVRAAAGEVARLAAGQAGPARLVAEAEEKEEEEEAPPPPPPPATPAHRRMPDFRIEHRGPQSTDSDPVKGRRCKVLPVEQGAGENRFVDDRRVAAKDIRESVRLSQEFEGKDHRPPHVRVPVVCGRCQNEYQVHPDTAPRRLDAEDSPTLYVCDRCINRPNRSDG